MIVLHRPALPELRFRQSMLEDPDTMAYNRAWGGVIPFPEEKWAAWYARWLSPGDEAHFYRYLRETGTGRFVGEAAYHLDGARGLWLADVIVAAAERGKGFGREGLRLLCETARKNGLAELCDDIAEDNPAIELFRKEGFSELGRADGCVLLKKRLS